MPRSNHLPHMSEMTTNTARQIVNGVHYKQETSAALIQALETARASGTRITIEYGNIQTGKAWSDGPHYGYVGASTTDLPILLATRQSSGGPCIMESSILEIRDVKTGQSIFKQDMVNDEELKVALSDTTYDVASGDREP